MNPLPEPFEYEQLNILSSPENCYSRKMKFYWLTQHRNFKKTRDVASASKGYYNSHIGKSIMKVANTVDLKNKTNKLLAEVMKGNPLIITYRG